MRHLRHADAAIGEHSAKPDGDPESRRLGLPMASNREAMCRDDYFVAAPDESLETFHARLKKIARERGVVVAEGRLANRLSALLRRSLFGRRPTALDPNHAFQVGLMDGRKGRESGRRRYGQEAPTADRRHESIGELGCRD